MHASRARKLTGAALWLVAATAGPATRTAGAEARFERIDWVEPIAVQQERPVRAAAPPPVCLGCGVEWVDHQTFDGRSFRLERHPGRHVALLLPEERPRRRLSDEEVTLLVDLLDLLYEGFADLVGGEPDENLYQGLLPIALVPTPIGGQAQLGNKGIEIDPGNENDLRKPLYFEGVHWLLTHEMGHNFDLYSPFTAYLVFHPHAWTWFTDLYVPYYIRQGENPQRGRRDQAGFERPPRSPREFLRLGLTGNWRPYVDDPAADWTTCVAADDCFWGANQYWGAFYLHLASQFGAATTRDFFRSLGARIAGGGFIPRDSEGREEIWLEAWAEATRSDVSCYAEALRWHSSDGLRERIRERYGRRAPLCADRDGDGFRPIEDDCDDRDPTVHPRRKDAGNGVDEDCDGLLDETSVKERKAARQEIPFPGQVAARGGSRGDEKEFVFDPGEEPIAWVQSCYGEDSGGWFFFLDGKREGRAEGTNGACIFGKVATRPGEPVRVRHDTHRGGPYELTVAPGDPWPVAWATLDPPAVKRRKVAFRITSDLSQIDAKPTHVRFWVTGTGWVATRRFKTRTRGAWRIPAGTPAGSYGVRAQLLRGGVPVSKVSPMTVFEIP